MDTQEIRGIISNRSIDSKTRVSAFKELVNNSATPKSIVECLIEDNNIIGTVAFSLWSEKESSQYFDLIIAIIERFFESQRT